MERATWIEAMADTPISFDPHERVPEKDKVITGRDIKSHVKAAQTPRTVARDERVC